MKVEKIYLVYFSPTETTKHSVQAVAAGWQGIDCKEIDLTLPASRKQQWAFEENSLVILGLPVYYGRMVSVGTEVFACLKGNHTPAVAVAVYGNRAYEDALIEMTDLMKAHGMVPVGGVASVGEHSFQNGLAAGRPDGEDLAVLTGFGCKIREKLEQLRDIKDCPDLQVPGDRPYRPYGGIPFAPVAGESCVKCGRCARECPVGAISMDDPNQTDVEKCIFCLRCVKYCPVHSRTVADERFAGMSAGLLAKAGGSRKEPECHL